MGRSAAPQDPLAELTRAIELITGRAATDEARGRFAKYLALLIAWNRTHHLTGYRTARDIVRGLFLDSLLFLPLLPPGARRLIDIGSGPGIPGVPLRIVRPDLSVTLVESRHKPVSFLAALKRELALSDIEIVHGRAGRDVEGSQGRYDCAVIRGVRLSEDLLVSVHGYLRPGGRVVAGGGPGATYEPEAPRARVETVAYPELEITRSFVVFDV